MHRMKPENSSFFFSLSRLLTRPSPTFRLIPKIFPRISVNLLILRS